ncbi:MAG TPA: phosphoribosylanthranilate isomerase [Firmicutes bacterium]|nr:phosphoribosylanthranilate isomerase [Bacillota bacterium]
MIQVKICGITNEDDALEAVAHGANAIGFVFAKKSPRCVSVEGAARVRRSLPVFTKVVGVFVEHTPEEILDVANTVRLDVLQLHGNYGPGECRFLAQYHPVIKVFHLQDDRLPKIGDYPADAFLVDSRVEGALGGTGVVCNWDLAHKLARRVPLILAGGLTPENVREGIARVRPMAIDVCSGVEAYPGKKDHGKLRELLQKVRSWYD